MLNGMRVTQAIACVALPLAAAVQKAARPESIALFRESGQLDLQCAAAAGYHASSSCTACDNQSGFSGFFFWESDLLELRFRELDVCLYCQAGREFFTPHDALV